MSCPASGSRAHTLHTQTHSPHPQARRSCKRSAQRAATRRQRRTRSACRPSAKSAERRARLLNVLAGRHAEDLEHNGQEASAHRLNDQSATRRRRPLERSRPSSAGARRACARVHAMAHAWAGARAPLTAELEADAHERDEDVWALPATCTRWRGLRGVTEEGPACTGGGWACVSRDGTYSATSTPGPHLLGAASRTPGGGNAPTPEIRDAAAAAALSSVTDRARSLEQQHACERGLAERRLHAASATRGAAHTCR